MVMQIKYDAEVDGIFFIVSNAPVASSEEVESGIIVDRDEDDHIVAVEILNFSQRKNGINLPIALEWINNEQRSDNRTASTS